MAGNAETVAADIVADLLALRRDVARLADAARALARDRPRVGIAPEPWRAALIAFGVGLSLGLISRARG
ncbi:MAG: hypothetical protein ABR970_22515 [Roseiarcus sp.]